MANASSPPDIAGRVRRTIVKSFRISDENDPAEFRMGSLPGWDSLGHMRLVSELEERRLYQRLGWKEELVHMVFQWPEQ